MEETQQQKDDLALLKSTSLSLRERGNFDTVHIFVTRHSFRDDRTDSVQMGVGNVFARQAQIKDYVKMLKAPDPIFFTEAGDDDDE